MKNDDLGNKLIRDISGGAVVCFAVCLCFNAGEALHQAAINTVDLLLNHCSNYLSLFSGLA
jgi:hypothetical protein